MVGLCDLPTELQHHIVLNLHPSAAVALRQTNRWFNTHISLHRLDRTAVHEYLHHLEYLPKRLHDFACFSCLSLKPDTAFPSTQLSAKGRFCIDCGVKDAKFEPYTKFDIGWDGGCWKVFCGACSSVQPLFCTACCCCCGCLAKARTWTGMAALRQKPGYEKLCERHLRF